MLKFSLNCDFIDDAKKTQIAPTVNFKSIFIIDWFMQIYGFLNHIFSKDQIKIGQPLYVGCRVTFGELLGQAVGNSAHELLIWFFDQPE